jgi:hypothetical protein
MTTRPNKSPEPRAVLFRHGFGAKADGTVSSAIANCVISPACLSSER